MNLVERTPSFLCHLTHNILDDPVWGADGHVYERSALTQLLSSTDNSNDDKEKEKEKKGEDDDSLNLTLLRTVPPTDAPQLQRVIQKLLFLVERPFSEQVAEAVVDDDMKKQLRRAHSTRDACFHVKTETTKSMNAAQQERKSLLQHNTLSVVRNKIEVEEQALAQEMDELERWWRRLQVRHKTIAHHDAKLDEHEKQVWSIINDQAQGHVKESDQCRSLERQVDVLHERLERLKRTNISNEAFHIWHEGPFGIINGFRLGRLPNIQVEWAEVNAAWGQAALLLATIAGKLGFTFQHYRVIPMGSYSKIAKIGQEKYQVYELSTTGSMGMFSRSTFNAGMGAFLVCLNELCVDAQNYDRGLLLPYGMLPERGEMVHNGVSVSMKLSGSTEEKWTTACKYMLTNLKWLLAWSTKTWRK